MKPLYSVRPVCNLFVLSCLTFCFAACGRDSGEVISTDDHVPGVGNSSMEAMPKPEEPSGPPFRPEYLRAMALTEQMKAAIEKFDRGFRMWDIADFSEKQIRNYPYSEKSLPYAIKGDYNGDGIEDIVVSGWNLEGNISLALLSSGTGYRVFRAAFGDDNPARAEEQKKNRHYTPACVLLHKAKGEKLDTTGDSATIPSYKILQRDAFFAKYGDDTFANILEWNPSGSKFDATGANLISLH